MAEQQQELRHWDSIEPTERTRLQVEYGYYLDTLPPTCSLETKIERFRHWLRSVHGIDYPG